MPKRTQYYPNIPTRADGDKIGPFSYSNPMYVSANLMLVINYNDENVKDGESVTYWQNGNPSDILTYKNGVLHGPFKAFNSKGKVQLTAMYENGLLEGHYKTYHADGELHTHRFYTKGEINGIDIINEKEPKEKGPK